MVFGRILKTIGDYFDVICFILAMFVADYAAFVVGKVWGLLAIAITIAIIGWLSEVISNVKGGE